MIVVSLGLVMFAPVAQAQRQEYEGVTCNAQTVNVAHSSPEAGIWSFDQKGINQSTHENKLFDNWTVHAFGVVKMQEGKVSWNGFSKRMAPDGEIIIAEFYGDGESGTTGHFIYGTGKWKGIKGEYKNKWITTGKPIVQNTAQFCEKSVGWIELPK